MTLTLDPAVEERIQRLVATGDYDDAGAVVADAMRLLEAHRRQLDELDAKLQLGIDQADRGEMLEWTPELRQQIRESAQRRARLGELPNPDVLP